jgi:hypothetical protein
MGRTRGGACVLARCRRQFLENPPAMAFKHEVIVLLLSREIQTKNSISLVQADTLSRGVRGHTAREEQWNRIRR